MKAIQIQIVGTKRPQRPHYGRAVIMMTDGAVYIRCSKMHLIERVRISDWESHWLHDRVFQPRWEIECSIDD